MAGKPIRLGKAAGELNVGVATLVEFLESKGVKIENNPNTKLESEHYDILQKEFADDQTLKEQSKGSGLRREKRETISIRDSRPEETVPAKEAEEPAAAPVPVEVPKVEITPEPPVVVEAPKPEPTTEAEPEKPVLIAPETVKVQVESEIKVIRTIDLNQFN